MSTFDPDLTIIGVLPGETTEQTTAVSRGRRQVGNSPDSAPSEPSEPHRGIELVRGSRRHLDDETQELLRQRLRACVVILFLAVFTYWVRSLFLDDAPMQGLEFLISGVLIVSLYQLSTGKSWSLRTLRRAEVGLFWSASVVLCMYQFTLLRHKAHAGDVTAALGAMKSCVIYFFGMIILYGTFIPNRWFRALKVVGPMALAPGIAPLILRLTDPDIQAINEHVATFEHVSDNILMLVLGVITSTYGTHIINTLREEIYKARQLGQYRLKELLGKGGMGEVYLAEHRLLKRKCAIKLIRTDQQTDPNALMRFEREVRTTASLSHPHTIDVYDYGRTDEGTFFYVMEFLPGMNLAEIVKRFGPLLPERAVSLLIQTCGALREAHEIGLIHRDIKPANIFAAQRGGQYDFAKLLDFGLVRTINHPAGNQSEGSNCDEPLERGLSGSIHFMAPEQADPDQLADQRSDIYALGATAYFLVTGKPPFTRDNGLEILQAHAQDDVIPPSQLIPDLPQDLESIILRCLAKTPERRYSTVSELEDALRHSSVAGKWTATDAFRWWSDHVQETAEIEIG
ncbi:MAG: Serine/threonine protein kinaserelated protein [Planctomycetaceae bacterium]|nr:Serine/threonine protein kinaserelated protein [Planctomycetaceae bacterium]